MNLQIGDSLDRIRHVPAAALAINAVVVLNGLVGIAIEAIAASAVGSLLVRGQVKITTAASETWVEGDEIFYDEANSVFTNVRAGHAYAGRAERAKGSSTTVGYVDLNAPRPAVGGQLLAFTAAVASGAAADVDTVVRQDCRVVDIIAQHDGAGEASDTLTVKDGDDNAISDAMDWSGADKAIVRAGTIDDAYATLSAGDTVRVSPADDDGGNDVGAGTVTILAVAV